MNKSDFVKAENSSLVTMSNCLVKATYNLSLNEMKILLLAFSKLVKANTLNPIDDYFITKQDLKRLNFNTSNLRRDLNSVVEKLMSRVVTFDTDSTTIKTHWVYRAELLKGKSENAVKIVIHPDVLPFLSNLTNTFTQIKIRDIAHFGSFYSFRVFFILMQYQNSKNKKIVMSLADFRAMLQIQDKYNLINDLKNHVLKIAKNEINQHTSFNMDFTLSDDLGRVGRGIEYTSITFDFRAKVNEKTYSSIPSFNDIVNADVDIDDVMEKHKKQLSEVAPINSFANTSENSDKSFTIE